MELISPEAYSEATFVEKKRVISYFISSASTRNTKQCLFTTSEVKVIILSNSHLTVNKMKLIEPGSIMLF
jgi:hypothetical protein